MGDKPRVPWIKAVRQFMDESTATTRRQMQSYLKRLDAFLHDLYLDEIDRDLIEKMISAMLKDWVTVHKRVDGKLTEVPIRPISRAAINRRLELLRAILNTAEKQWEVLASAPHVRMLSTETRRIRWLTREEADRLLAELPPHLEAMARFSLATGLRESNVTGLEWSQVDLERRVAWIHPDQAKARRAIGVPLNSDAVVVLRQQQGKHPRRVFTFEGKPVTRAGARAFRKARARAGIKDFRWHDLRHTWASWHVQNGTPLHVLQELGGWSDIRMVQRYAHLAPEHLAEHAESVSGPRVVVQNWSSKEG